MSGQHTPEPLGYAIFREGRQVGFERTLAVANHWVEAEIVPLCRMSERDELLAALEQIASGEADNRSILSGGECQRIAYDAIATAKGTTP